MTFLEIFTSYWDMAITGFIGGLVVYLMCEWKNKIKNKFIRAILIFGIMVLLVLLYSICVWLI